MIFFQYKEKNNFKGMFKHRFPGFTILDLGCALSKDGPAIQEIRLNFSNRQELTLKIVRICLQIS